MYKYLKEKIDMSCTGEDEPHTLCTPSLTPPSLPFHAAFPTQAAVASPPTSLEDTEGPLTAASQP